MKVTFQEAFDTFVASGTSRSQALYREWEARTDLVRAGVVDFVTHFDHEELFSLSRSEFDRVSTSTEHPLRDISPRNKQDKIAIDLVADVSTPWSIMQLFHDYIQQKHKLPMWQEFRAWLIGDAKERLWEPYKAILNWDAADTERQSLLSRGTAWRLGNLYYSALREVDILITLRDHGVPLKYHLLADALYAVDFWRDDKLASVFIPNPHFKDDNYVGRKPRPEIIFEGSRFRCRDFSIAKRAVHGKYWPVSAATTDAIHAFVSNESGV